LLFIIRPLRLIGALAILIDLSQGS